MPTCSLPKSGPTPARVSTLKSVVFPAAGRPTIPASSMSLVLRELLLQGGESAMLERLHRPFRLLQDRPGFAVREVEQELEHQHLLLLERVLRLGHFLLGLPAPRGPEVIHRKVVGDAEEPRRERRRLPAEAPDRLQHLQK